MNRFKIMEEIIFRRSIKFFSVKLIVIHLLIAIRTFPSIHPTNTFFLFSFHSIISYVIDLFFFWRKAKRSMIFENICLLRMNVNSFTLSYYLSAKTLISIIINSVHYSLSLSYYYAIIF